MRIQTTTDYSSIEEISARLVEASDALCNMAERVAKAKQVRDYDSDRRKRALSCSVKDFLSRDQSATAAEHNGRASEAYKETMLALGRELVIAEKIISEWDAMKIRWETARSLLSVQKSLVANL